MTTYPSILREAADHYESNASFFPSGADKRKQAEAMATHLRNLAEILDDMNVCDIGATEGSKTQKAFVRLFRSLTTPLQEGK